MFFLCVVCRGFAVRSSHPFIVFYTFLTSAVHGNEPYDILPCISFSKIKKSCPAFYYYTKYMSMSSFSRWGQIFSLWLAAFHHFFSFSRVLGRLGGGAAKGKGKANCWRNDERAG